jgi:hypothetical protein
VPAWRCAARCADIGGSLIKLVYFSPDAPPWRPGDPPGVAPEDAGGRLHFLKARRPQRRGAASAAGCAAAGAPPRRAAARVARCAPRPPRRRRPRGRRARAGARRQR